MLYTKPKNKNTVGKWITRLIQMALVLGILFFGYEAINRFTNTEPAMDTQEVKVVVIQPVIIQPVEVIEVQRVEPEPALDAYDYHRMGLEHHLSNEINEAILDYSRAIGMNESLSSSWLNRGVAYEQMGNRTNAMFDFMHYMTRDGISVIAHPLVVDSTNMRFNLREDLVYTVPVYLDRGEVLNVNVDSVKKDLVDPLIILTDSNGNPVAASDDSRRQNGSLISMNSRINNFTAQNTGRYMLLVSHAGGGENGINPGEIDVKIDIKE